MKKKGAKWSKVNQHNESVKKKEGKKNFDAYVIHLRTLPLAKI